MSAPMDDEKIEVVFTGRCAGPSRNRQSPFVLEVYNGEECIGDLTICPLGSQCTRADCVGVHISMLVDAETPRTAPRTAPAAPRTTPAAPRTAPRTAAPAASRAAPQGPTIQRPCRHGFDCFSYSCPFTHPVGREAHLTKAQQVPCRYGSNCRDQNNPNNPCPFAH